MPQSKFTAFYPVPCAAGEHWVAWYEAMLVNGCLLIRCVPVTSFPLPEQASALLLDFGDVIAMRGSADPFNLENPDVRNELPREQDGRLTSLFNFSSDTPWLEEAKNFYPTGIRYYFLCDIHDQVLGVLSRGEPQIRLEREAGYPSPEVAAFLSASTGDA